MRHSFVHELDDNPPLGDFETALDVPPGARIQFQLDGADIWVSPDRAGWLHLARICAEMGLRSESKPGYHFHRTYDWNASSSAGHEVSFELAANVDDQEHPAG